MTLTPLFPITLVGVLQWLLPSLMPTAIPFGVRIPRDRADASVIAVWRRRYRYATAAVTVAAAAGTLLAAGRVWAGPVALGVELVAGLVLYLLARRRITAVKSAEDWFGGRRQVSVADTALRTDPERYPWLWAMPAIVLSAATAVAGIVEYPNMPARLAVHFGPAGRPDHYALRSPVAAFAPVLAQLTTTAILLVLARAALRGKAQLDAEDPQAVVRYRRFVATTARTLLFFGGCLNVTFLFGALASWQVIGVSGPALLALTSVPGLVGLAVLLTALIRTGQGGSRLRLAGPTTAPGARVNRDDDSLYRWGLIYFNHDDPALFVPKRFGVGWTINMARPLAWLLLAGTLALVVLVSLAR